MGGGISSELMAEEKPQWGCVILGNGGTPSAELAGRFERGEELQLMSTNGAGKGNALGRRHGLEYQRYFVTNGSWDVEFELLPPTDPPSTRLDSGRVAIRRADDRGVPDVIDGKSPFMTWLSFMLTDSAWGRMERVCSATNYSHCLRNSEHVARYIAEDMWISNMVVS
eukprot:COSAG01_NODE_28884_length_650_cov_1.029038_1_plen_167_part_01